MPVNKNARIRYEVLDRCLSNKNRKFFIKDLIEECCKELARVNGDLGSKGAEGVSREQIYKDLNNMEMIYGVQIDRLQDGHKKYITYAEDSKTLRDSPLQQEEIDLVTDALLILKRFEGIPQFDWTSDLENKFFTTSQLGGETSKVVSFQHNTYLQGMNKWYKPLFDAIVNERVIEVTYHPFDRDAYKVVVTPYHLKQYNNRWFLIAKHPDYEILTNFAIDRIEDVVETSKKYVPLAEGFSFEDYYSEVVGVSITDTDVMDVVLHVTKKALGYIVTKPLHESQSSHPVELEDGRWEVRLKVKDNYELRSLLRSFGEQVEVVGPEDFRKEMKASAEAMFNLYNS